jgi:hypothetical protein
MVPNYIVSQNVLYFKKIGKKLVLFERQQHSIAKEGSPEERALKDAFLDVMIHSFEIEAAEGENYLIEANSFFFNPPVPGWLMASYGIGGMDAANSWWSKVKSFPDNVELDARLTVRGGGTFDNMFFKDTEKTQNVGGPQNYGYGYGLDSNQVEFHFSLVRKVKSDYKPRVADERIGYFTVDVKDYSNPFHDKGMVRYINRWNLEKADPGSKESVVKKPIVYYISPSTPYRYRKYIRDGILEWNKAFEKLGFIGAVEARVPQNPDEFEPSDVRYSSVCWVAHEEGFGFGPVRNDPWTGEILDADIVITSGMAEYADYMAGVFGARNRRNSLSFEEFLNLKNKFRELVKHQVPTRHYEMLRSMALDFAVMAAEQLKGEEGSDKEEEDRGWKDEFIGAYLKDTVTHEVGHTLGLRHNFKASSVPSIEQLKDPSYVKEHQISSSVMDYNGFNFLRESSEIPSMMNSIGEYDYLAIRYGYLPIEENEKEELNTIAQTLREKNLLYGTDEDSWLGPDPHCKMFDLGDDLVASAIERIQLLNQLLDSASQSLLTTGSRLDKVRDMLRTMVYQYGYKCMDVTGYIGGVYVHRDRYNDPGAKQPYEAVPERLIEDTFQFFSDYVFKKNVLKIPVDLLEKGRVSPWNWQDNEMFPAEYMISNMKLNVLFSVFSPWVLDRLNEYYDKLDSHKLSQSYLFDKMYDCLFNEMENYVKTGRYSNDWERTLPAVQMGLVDILTYYVRHGSRIPYKSSMYAVNTLKRIGSLMGRFLVASEGKNLNDKNILRSHAEEVLRLLKALESENYIKF